MKSKTLGVILLLVTLQIGVAEAQVIDNTADDVLIETESELDVNLSTSTTTNIQSGAKVTGEIEVKREDINESSDAVLIGAQSVNTEEDLSLYAKSVLITDSNVREIDADEDGVEFVYARTGKVLGLFSVNYEIKVSVETDRKIDVDYPWYATLIRDNKKREVRDRMKTEVGIFLDKNSNASGVVEMDARVEALLINLMHSILSAELTGRVNTET